MRVKILSLLACLLLPYWGWSQGGLILKLKENAGYASLKGRVSGKIKNVCKDVFSVTLGPQDNLSNVIKRYEAMGLFDYVEPDYTGYAADRHAEDILPDDPLFNRQWSLDNDGTFPLGNAKAGADIGMRRAWEITQGDPQIIVAILDSGIKPDHPEFSGRLWINPGEIPENNIDDDGNGYVDDIHGWSFSEDKPDLTDPIGHGTHVTGVLGATGNNSYGYAGMDWNCRLMVCKVLKADYSGLYSWWVAAIHYAVDHGARVINMSLGGTAYSRALEDAINYAYDHNVLVIASTQNNNAEEIQYPAGYGHTLAVGATDPGDWRSTSFGGVNGYGSNYGNHLDVVAPGNYIYGLNHSDDNATTMLSGTSQAAPHVSGLAALLLAQDPSRSVQALETRIFESADDQVGAPNEDKPGWDKYYGYGRINAARALAGDLEKELPEVFTASPNPFRDELHLVANLREAGAVRIYLYNAMGQHIHQLHNAPSARTLDLTYTTEGLAAGIYLIRLETGGSTITRKVVKISGL